ncbi:hypothetical protein DFH09DRAFT_1201925 [Mycena vulgaris]|nr:hypothetical protein DFH09DRAFT_1201925 [Mycena vulgaris]
MEVEQVELDLNNHIKSLQSATRGCLKCSDTVSLSFELCPWPAAHIGLFCLPIVLVFIFCKAFEQAALGVFSILTPNFLLYSLGLSGFSLAMKSGLGPGLRASGPAPRARARAWRI